MYLERPMSGRSGTSRSESAFAPATAVLVVASGFAPGLVRGWLAKGARRFLVLPAWVALDLRFFWTPETGADVSRSGIGECLMLGRYRRESESESESE